MAYVESEYQRLMQKYRPERSFEPSKDDIISFFSDLEKTVANIPLKDTITFHTAQDYKFGMYHFLALVEIYAKQL